MVSQTRLAVPAIVPKHGAESEQARQTSGLKMIGADVN